MSVNIVLAAPPEMPLPAAEALSTPELLKLARDFLGPAASYLEMARKRLDGRPAKDRAAYAVVVAHLKTWNAVDDVTAAIDELEAGR
jgi:hypothetical protein